MTQTRLDPHLHPCVHALAARADFELPGWASRGAAVWAAAGISSWRAFSGQLAAYVVSSVASRLHDASWGSTGLCAPRRCALVALRSRSVERLLSGRKFFWGAWKSAKFDTVSFVVCVGPTAMLSVD